MAEWNDPDFFAPNCFDRIIYARRWTDEDLADVPLDRFHKLYRDAEEYSDEVSAEGFWTSDDTWSVLGCDEPNAPKEGDEPFHTRHTPDG